MDIDILLLKRYTTLKIDNSFIYIQYNETIVVFNKFFNSVGNGRTNHRHLHWMLYEPIAAVYSLCCLPYNMLLVCS